MDIEEVRAYDVLFDSTGWKLLLEEAQSEIELLKSDCVGSVENFEQLCFARGQLFQLTRLVDLEDNIITQLKAEQANAELEESEDAPL